MEQTPNEARVSAIEEGIITIISQAKLMPLDESLRIFSSLEALLKAHLPQVSKTVKTLQATVKALDSE